MSIIMRKTRICKRKIDAVSPSFSAGRQSTLFGMFWKIKAAPELLLSGFAGGWSIENTGLSDCGAPACLLVLYGWTNTNVNTVRSPPPSPVLPATVVVMVCSVQP